MRLHLFAASLVLAVTPALGAQSSARTPIGTASPTLTPAIRVGNMVYGSGQLGTSRTDPDSSITGQTKRSLDNVKRVLEEAGTTMENAVKCTVFLTSAAEFQGMNAVYRTYWPSSPPARSTVVVAALVTPSAKVEIECVAVMP